MNKTIDASNRKIGRVATEVAATLMGKDRVDFVRNAIPNIKVEVINASKLDIDDNKKKTKIYQRYSGYPGGRKELSLNRVTEKKGMKEVIRIAVRRMLPPNRLRAKMLKNLTISE